MSSRIRYMLWTLQIGTNSLFVCCSCLESLANSGFMKSVQISTTTWKRCELCES